jgi:hypothetical protein
VVLLQSCMPEAFGSNLGRNVRVSTQSLQENGGILLSSRQRYHLLHPYVLNIHYHLFISFDVM